MLDGCNRCYPSIAAGRPLELNEMEQAAVAGSTQAVVEADMAVAAVAGSGRGL